MKRKIVLLLFVGFTALICAQKYPASRSEFVPEHDFRFGIGWKPFEAANITFGEPFDDYNFGILDSKNYYSGARYTTNSLFLEYIYQANSWFGIGATATYLAYYNNYYDGVTDNFVGYNMKEHISLYPTIRLTWVRVKGFNMYTSFGIGRRMVMEQDETRDHKSNSTRFDVAGQFTMLGFTIGQRIYGFTDLMTLGSQGMLNVGVGYRLSVPQKKK